MRLVLARMRDAILGGEMRHESLDVAVKVRDDLSEDWKRILVDRLAMYRSLLDTTIAKFGETRFLEYDRAYSHFVGLFDAGKLGGGSLATSQVER
jgi:hypothetical protein